MVRKCKNIKKFFDGIKKIIKKIYDYSQPIKYDDNYMKIKFNTENNISPNKIVYFFYNNYNNKICNTKR